MIMVIAVILHIFFIESNKKYYETKASNNYFTDVGSSISSSISHVIESIYDYKKKKWEKCKFLMGVTNFEIVYVVNELSIKIGSLHWLKYENNKTCFIKKCKSIVLYK